MIDIENKNFFFFFYLGRLTFQEHDYILKLTFSLSIAIANEIEVKDHTVYLSKSQ